MSAMFSRLFFTALPPRHAAPPSWSSRHSQRPRPRREAPDPADGPRAGPAPPGGGSHLRVVCIWSVCGLYMDNLWIIYG